VDTSVIELTVAGVSTSVLAAGPAQADTAVVFVHGNPGSGPHWQSLIAPVSEFARCIAPTMPGYRDAREVDAFDYTVDGYARHLGHVLDALGVRLVHLVTHDLGGIWGLAWAAAHRTNLASLTLMSIGVLPDYRWHRYARLYRVPLIGEFVLAAAGRSSVRRSLQAGSKRLLPEASLMTSFASTETPEPATLCSPSIARRRASGP
jgi:pimeloyl-ACP methyl ester carboxylesterase